MILLFYHRKMKSNKKGGKKTNENESINQT